MGHRDGDGAALDAPLPSRIPRPFLVVRPLSLRPFCSGGGKTLSTFAEDSELIVVNDAPGLIRLIPHDVLVAKLVELFQHRLVDCPVPVVVSIGELFPEVLSDSTNHH